jgi:hypothetical protein
MPTPKTEATAKKAFGVLLRSDLEAIRLVRCSADGPDIAVELKPHFHLDFKQPIGKFRGVIKGHLTAESEFSIDSFDSSDAKNRVFTASCAFELIYHLEDGYTPTKEDADAFSKAYAVFNAWPYAREFFQNITHRMDLTPPPLPLLRLPGVPRGLETIVEMAKAKRPKKKK